MLLALTTVRETAGLGVISSTTNCPWAVHVPTNIQPTRPLPVRIPPYNRTSPSSLPGISVLNSLSIAFRGQDSVAPSAQTYIPSTGSFQLFQAPIIPTGSLKCCKAPRRNVSPYHFHSTSVLDTPPRAHTRKQTAHLVPRVEGNLADSARTYTWHPKAIILELSHFIDS